MPWSDLPPLQAMPYHWMDLLEPTQELGGEHLPKARAAWEQLGRAVVQREQAGRRHTQGHGNTSSAAHSGAATVDSLRGPGRPVARANLKADDGALSTSATGDITGSLSLTLAINESIIAHRVLLTEAAARDGAVAIDGSPGSYHIAKAAAGSRNASKWHVHLQGGGWCWDVPSCAGRALGSKGSSDLAPNNHSIKVLPGECACAQSGYFSADPARNPTMHDWCDSAPGQDCFPKPRKQDLCVASTCPFFLLGVVICGSETSWGAGTMST